MDGKYSEKLKTGGELVVSKGNWHIRYYFSGPDLRYNGQFVEIYGNKIELYINAWKNNFSKYLELRKMIPEGGCFSTPGEMGMQIHIGLFDGVCLRSYHMPINTEVKLNSVIADYKYANDRAITVKKLMNW